MATEGLGRSGPGWAHPIVLGLAAMFMATNLWQRVVVFDEGYASYCAWRIAAGELPYRDFQANYSPGSFYMNALAFQLFGTSLITLRAVDLFVRLGLAVGCGLAAWRGGAGAWSWAAFLIGLAFLGTISMFGYAAVPGLALFFAAAHVWDSFTRGPSRKWALAVGFLTGLLFFFRQDFGLYAAAGFAVHGLLLRAVARRPLPFRLVSLAALAATLLSAALFLPAILAVGWHRMLDLLFLEPLQLRSGLYRLPLPVPELIWFSLKAWAATGARAAMDVSQRWAAFFGTLIAIGLALGWSLWGLRRGREGSATVLLYSLLGGLLIRQGLNRADLAHMFPMLLMALACLLPLMRQPGVVWVARPVALLFGLFFLVVPFGDWVAYAQGLRSLPSSRLTRSHGLPVPLDMEAAATRVNEGTLPQERIYVANANMEQGLISATLFYFLADRASASYYEYIRRPLPPPDIEALYAALRDPGTGAVVIWDGLHERWGVSPLDASIRAFSSRGERYGDFVVLFKPRASAAVGGSKGQH